MISCGENKYQNEAWNGSVDSYQRGYLWWLTWVQVLILDADMWRGVEHGYHWLE